MKVLVTPTAHETAGALIFMMASAAPHRLLSEAG
jgi:hypothetical protein